jgi:hypothetical protein
LSESLKRQIRSSLIRWNARKQSRFLTKNHDNQWAELPEQMAVEFVHEQLVRQDDIFADAAMRQLNYLSSETKFGAFRETSLHQKFIPSLLRSLELRVLQRPRASTVDLPKAPTGRNTRVFVSPKSFASRIPMLSRFHASRSGIPSGAKVVEPFLGAWLKVGDDIEGRYANEHNEWYRGTIVRAKGHTLTWDIEYNDGEIGVDMCRGCVRPFQDYRVGEIVEVQLNSDDQLYVAARISAVYGGNRYAFARLDDGFVVDDFETVDIRRYKSEAEYVLDGPFRLGEEVEARYFDEDGDGDHDGKWYLGTIVNILENDQAYGVEYFDGSYQTNLSAADIRSLS